MAAHLTDRRTSRQFERGAGLANPPFAGPKAVLADHSVTRTGSPPRTAASSDSTRPAPPSAKGLSPRRRRPAAGHDARSQRVHPPLSALLPRGFHRIRHYGLLAGATRRSSLALTRELVAVASSSDDNMSEEPLDTHSPCPAAADICLSSRRSPAGVNLERRRTALHRPGGTRHDPAWPGLTAPRTSCGSGSDVPRVINACQRPGGYHEPPF
jgi:hypothetical protein